MYLTRILAILALLLLPLASAICPFLQVGAISDLSVNSGVVSSFPITVRNNAQIIQNVYLSTINSNFDLDTYFDSSLGILAPNEEKTFTYFVGTNGNSGGNYSFDVEVSSDSGFGICMEKIQLKLQVNPINPTPNPNSAVSVSIYPTGLKQLNPLEKQEYLLEIKNGLNEEIYVSLDLASSPIEKAIRFEESAFKMAAGEFRTTKAVIMLPAGTPGGDYESVIRVKTTSSCCVEQFLFPLKVRSNLKTADIRLINRPLECIDIVHGKRKFVELGVRNYGEIAGPYTLQLTGDDVFISQVKLPLRQFELQPGEYDYFNLTLLADEKTPIDTYRFHLTAKYFNFILFDEEFCYNVEGKSDFEIEKPNALDIMRGTTKSIEFRVRNIGTLKDDYIIETRPLINSQIFVEPEQFSLSPNELQIVNLILQTSSKTPLGKQLVQAIIRPRSSSGKTETFEFNVAPSNKSSESFIKIDAPAIIKAREGEYSYIIANIQNTKSASLEDVKLTLEGIPGSWVTTDLPKTILGNKIAPFKVSIKPSKSGIYKIKYSAVSGGEISKMDATLNVEAATRELVYSASISPNQENGVVKSTTVTMVIRNTGNTQLTGLTITTPAQDLNIVPLSYIQSLEAGESRQIRVEISPLKDTAEREIMLNVGSAEGASKANAILLPAMRKVSNTADADSFPWKIIAIIILLLVLFFVMGRQTL